VDIRGVERRRRDRDDYDKDDRGGRDEGRAESAALRRESGFKRGCFGGDDAGVLLCRTL